MSWMRALLLALGLLAAAASLYFWRYTRSSFSGYSSEQLELLEREYQARGDEHRVSRELIETERRRRLRLSASAAAAGAALLGAILLPRKKAPRGMTT